MDINQLFDMAQNFTARIDASGFEGQPAAYELDVTGAGGGVFSAEVKNNRITLSRTPRPDAVCKLSASADTIAALLSGKLKPMTAMALGKVKIQGDIGAVMRFASLLR